MCMCWQDCSIIRLVCVNYGICVKKNEQIALFAELSVETDCVSVDTDYVLACLIL
jgi:hypothetical protein